MIKIPFSYRLRVSDPLVGDYMDLNVSPVGEFRLQKRTERTGIYQLGNLYQAKENP